MSILLILVLLLKVRDGRKIALFSRIGQAFMITVLSSRFINLFRVVYKHTNLNCPVSSVPWNNDQTILQHYYIANYQDLWGKSHCQYTITIDMGEHILHFDIELNFILEKRLIFIIFNFFLQETDSNC